MHAGGEARTDVFRPRTIKAPGTEARGGESGLIPIHINWLKWLLTQTASKSGHSFNLENFI